MKIKVPCTALGNSEAYGFVLSLGWHDPLLEQARKVRNCKFTLKDYTGTITKRDSGIRKIREIFAEEEKDLRAEIAKEIAKQIGHIRILGIPIQSIPGVSGLIQDIVDAALKGFLDTLENLLDIEDDEWLLRVGMNADWAAPTSRRYPNRSRIRAASPICGKGSGCHTRS